MAKRFERKEVLMRLNQTIEAGKPVIGVGAGTGLVAKCAELAGADLIIVYPSGRSRHMGLPTTIIGDPNTVTLEMSHEILHVVKETPVIAGIHATDPTRDMETLLKQFINLGYSGVINYPSVGLYGENHAEVMTASGLGYNKERNVMLLARKMGLFTMSYVYRVKEVKFFADAVDVIIPHVGWTAGGLVGSKYHEKMSLAEASSKIQKMAEVAKGINPSLIILCHGGPIVKPEDTKYIYQHTDAVGFVGGSSTERIPIENAIMETVKNFKNISLMT
ncbi:MAG: phosphoenolpyruvate hydrolase family protein [Candidatus Baldrarchaeia archaeon]